MLKSGNTVVLRTGGAALRTVTALVDDVLRPALEAGGHPAGRGRPRAHARARGRRGARLAAAPDPARDPARERPVDGGARAARRRARRADARARRGRRRALRPLGRRPGEGGALARASLDRLGVCNRLNLALADSRDAGGSRLLAGLRRARARGARHRARGRARRRGAARHAASGTSGPAIPTAWHRDARRRRRRSTTRCGSRTTRPPGLAATIVTEDEAAADAFLDGYRGTAAFWNAPTRFTDGFALLGTPETGHQRRLDARAARPGHVPRSLAAPVPRGRRRHAAPVTVVVKLGSTLVVDGRGRVRRSLLRSARGGDRASSSAAASRSASSRRARSRSASPRSGSSGARGDAAAAGGIGGRAGAAAGGVGRRRSRRGLALPRSCCRPATSPSARAT